MPKSESYIQNFCRFFPEIKFLSARKDIFQAEIALSIHFGANKSLIKEKNGTLNFEYEHILILGTSLRLNFENLTRCPFKGTVHTPIFSNIQPQFCLKERKILMSKLHSCAHQSKNVLQCLAEKLSLALTPS